MASKRQLPEQKLLTLAQGLDGRFYTPEGLPVEIPKAEKQPDGYAVRHRVSGDHGLKFKKGETWFVRYDRPGQDYVKPFMQDEWVELETNRPLAAIHLAEICFVATSLLGKRLAIPHKEEWGRMPQAEREEWVSWINGTPTKLTGARRELFLGMRDKMLHLMGDQ